MEGQVALLPVGHRLAACETVHLADLRGETQPRFPSSPVGAPDAGPRVSDGVQLMQLVALGRAVAVVPESVRHHVRHDLVCVPVVDAPAVRVLVAWSERSRSRSVAAFLRAAAAVTERADLAARAAPSVPSARPAAALSPGRDRLADPTRAGAI